MRNKHIDKDGKTEIHSVTILVLFSLKPQPISKDLCLVNINLCEI